MKVIGPPNWPSTAKLKEALKDAPGREFVWGRSVCRGVEQLRRLRNAELPAIPFTTDLAEARVWTKTLTVLGRRNEHTQGRDIVLPQDRRWLKRDYWTVYLPFVHEFRVHIFDEKMLLLGQKIQSEPSLSSTNERRLKSIEIRSRSRGWHLHYLTKNVTLTKPQRKDLKELCVEGLRILGMVYGAADVGLTEEGDFVILEINSAPALGNDRTLEKYVEAIKGYVNAD